MPAKSPEAKARKRAAQRRWYERNRKRLNAQSTAWALANPERRKAIARKSYAKNLVAYMLLGARRRAAERGLPFELVAADIFLPEKCPVLGISLDYSRSGRAGHPRPNSPSLDRIVPSRGYVRGNVAVISMRANTIKSDATPEEIMLVANYYRMFG